MSLRNIDIESALRRVADRRIEEAMREGKFDNLAGRGLPLDLEPAPADENARMTWWALKILKQNEVIPDEVRWLKALDYLREQIAAATSESRLRLLVCDHNALVQKLNTLGTNAIHQKVTPLSVNEELAHFHARHRST